MVEVKPLQSMREKDILAKFTILKQIKPREDWVIFTKQRIFGDVRAVGGVRAGFGSAITDTVSYLSYLVRKPAFALAAFLLLLAGGVALQVTNQQLKDGLSQAEEEFQDTLASLELAQMRFDELKTAVQSSDPARLPVAIKNFQERNAQAGKDFVRLVENSPEKALQAGLKLVQLQKEKSQLERVLGTTLGTEENKDVENATKILLEQEFSDLETRTLTEEQVALFKEAKVSFDEGDYSAAIEKVWQLSQ
ncbi:MAG: hypothetical protein A3A27_01790 [Candidatus Wildermuthbacteria bacterium RIFCSPLOWO2_01_FULL_47_18]|uniref:DUF5667 domain-containing protein n=2 Tax=Candidatus Wildermuthiibacteriota TaxID=1817923 RepID=A0A1G2RJD7_9BACT|nr:MAG: hypothetical protein A3J68_00485 [Candidatus Wildermuthbacteria bacterium RIFCSPHIGHO2_02_FULL_48_16]OHA72412.1 MAG: hypothetical protein A3A27_01790 [Candidatus Wildermuthbacteria bacterium RIFCSPLOWO2_01_FULL_47_18]